MKKLVLALMIAVLVGQICPLCAVGAENITWRQLTETSTSEEGKLARIADDKVQTGSEPGYRFKVYELRKGNIYKIFGFGYDRTIFYIAVLGETDFLRNNTKNTAAISNVECGTDAYPEGYTYHTVTLRADRDCFVYVNYRTDDEEAKVWAAQESGGYDSMLGDGVSLAAASGERGVYIHDGVYDCFRKDGGTYIIRRFARRGPNQLFQWSALLLGDLDRYSGVQETVQFAGFSTDIVGPVSLYNTELFPGKYNAWSGGNHSVSGTELPTAEQHSMKCLVDGEEILEDGIYYGDVRFRTVNYLYFPQSITDGDLSTAQQAITEYRDYFIKDQMHVRVRLHFEENVTVATYYGLQAVTAGFEDILFANNEYYAKLEEVTSSVSLKQKERKIMLSAANGLHMDLELADLGLGTYTHNAGEDSARAYLPKQAGEGENKKVYFVCISGNEKIAAGSDLVWEGAYSLYFQ